MKEVGQPFLIPLESLGYLNSYKATFCFKEHAGKMCLKQGMVKNEYLQTSQLLRRQKNICFLFFLTLSWVEEFQHAAQS